MLVYLLAPTHRAEETNILTALNTTTLYGFVDTTTIWWVGPQLLPGRAGPVNDDIATAELVQTAKIFTPTNLTEATLESFEPVQPNQSGSVWYRWPVSRTGIARIAAAELLQMIPPAATSTGSALSDESIFYPWGGIINVITVGGVTTTIQDGYIVHTGYRRWWTRLTAYRQTGSSDFAVVQSGGYLEFNVSAGEGIWVCLEVYYQDLPFPDAYEATSSLPQALYFDVTPFPINDSFSSNLSVSHSSSGIFSGHVLGATREVGEPNLGPDFSGDSVWFHFTAATYGAITIGRALDAAPMAVFTGSELSNLKLVAKASYGGVTFFGEEGKTYHLAVYAKLLIERSFNIVYSGPKYRLYETTLDALMPPGFLPHFYGVRGATMLFYAKTSTGWNCVEIEPIVNQSADLLIRPNNPIDGQLRVITIDETLPAPRIQLRPARGVLVPDVIGYPGQTCAISYSTDLLNWSNPQIRTLTSAPLSLAAISSAAPTHFFRVTQSLPQPTSPQVVLEPQPPPTPSDAGGSAFTRRTIVVPTPDEPLQLTPLDLVSLPGQP